MRGPIGCVSPRAVDPRTLDVAPHVVVVVTACFLSFACRLVGRFVGVRLETADLLAGAVHFRNDFWREISCTRAVGVLLLAVTRCAALRWRPRSPTIFPRTKVQGNCGQRGRCDADLFREVVGSRRPSLYQERNWR